MSLADSAQRRAAAPGASSWVSANAGSGKTRVLTDRVARLLLAGTHPARVLCLTYTKAAAAEMQTRLFRTLGRWAMLDDAALRAALNDLGEPGDTISAERLAEARTLFAGALETPGGLKIQTIHAFCEALLRRFPLEAGVAPRFSVLDDRKARALREEVLDAFALDTPEEFAELAHHLAREDIDTLLVELARHRAAFAGPFDSDALAATLGARPGTSLAALADDLLRPARACLEALLPHLAASGPKDAKAAEKLAVALGATDPMEKLAALEGALLFGSSAKVPFGSKAGAFPTKALRAAHPALMEALDDLCDRLADARPLRLANAAHAKSAALNRFGRAWLAAWNGRKAALGLLDFDDMIDRTEALLARPGTAAWVLWRLDGGIDHILVDEAQDTSPAQWRVIQSISEEFFAGRGARDVERTIFVVGDEKQSIYSFQGADPGEFAAKASHYTERLAALGSELQRCDLLYSFRSAGPVLELVDRVFTGPAGEGLSRIEHRAIDTEKPGRVEVWPFLPRPERPEQAPWDDPVDKPGPQDPVQALARRIAAEIATWLAETRVLPGENRAIRAGDVMILVQRRNALFDAIIRELKRAEVPVAGADLLRIGGELAVADLLAALRFAATPGDDLSLAALLRSPLGGLSEDDLFEIAHDRGKAALGAALRSQPPERWAPVRALLDDLLRIAEYQRPFEILSRILIRHDGRRKLAARLGPEAEEGVDALLDQALAYESVEAPSLTGFLDWLDRDEVAVKRRMDEGLDQVRVMTVHGAKGLEAPIVILPDTAPRSESANPPQVLRLGDGCAVWRVGASEAPAAVAAAESARCGLVRAENRRLLYVALTRAKSWLIVAGAGDPSAPGESWHALVSDAMAGLPITREPMPEGEALVYARNWSTASAGHAAPPAPPAALPGWVREPAPPGAAEVRPVSPSGLGGAHVMPGDAEDALPEAEAKARGSAVHRLLEHLHGLPVAERESVAARLLPGAPDLAERLAEAAAVLDAPDLAPLFAEGLAEVPIAAELSELGGRRIFGRIDRLLVTPERVLAVDFKSNRVVPPVPELVPEGILRQMGAYRAALRRVFPGRQAATAILWTRDARLMPLPDALVDAALVGSVRDALAEALE